MSGPAGGTRVVARRASSTRRRRGADGGGEVAGAQEPRVGSGSVARTTAASNGASIAPATRDGGGTRPPTAGRPGGVALERRPAGHALPGHHPEGVDVGPPVDHPAAQHLGAQ